ncbi:MAG: cache domain-containing protein, partial [Candidatus Thiodiazotropha sp.]
MSHRFRKLYALSLLLLLLTAAVVHHFTERHLRANLEEKLRLVGNTLVSQLGKKMELTFSGITSDLILLSRDKHLELHHQNPRDQHNLTMLQNSWINFATLRKHYGQIRFLDRNGIESLRINYNHAQANIVPPGKLQSKRHRYYFKDVIGLPPGSIYVSPLDLNIENHQIELPVKPVIRFATTVSNAKDEKIGVMLLNYLAEELLDEFTLATSGFYGQAMLLNQEGYPLISPDSAQTWNFMFPDSPQSTLYTRHPSIRRSLMTEQRGQHLTSEGLFTFDHVDPA